MTKLWAYLKSIWYPILLFLIPLGVVISTFWIFQVDLVIITYVIILCLFLGLILLGVGYSHFEYRQTLIQELEELREENLALRDELHHLRMETENYFLNWLHQMKTPIAGAQLLLREVQGETASEMRLLLTDIDKYTGMALSYIKLMNPSTDLDFTTISLDEMIQPILKKYRYQFFYYQISIDYQALETKVVTDGHWSSIMIEQILSNALKYCHENGSIKISFIDETQELAIQDDGVGIQPSDLDKIFDKGYVGFNGRLHEKASGLGLYLVDLIAQRLSQPVRVESELGQGSTFYIKFNLTSL